MKTTFYEMDKLSTFLASRKTILAQGASAQIGPEAKKLGATKVLVVTDQGVVKAGLADPVKASLEDAGLSVEVYDGVLPEPPARVVDQASEMFRSGGFDLCLGLGGGSSLDSAKMVAALAANPGSILDYVGMDMVPKKGAPLILVPTTAGTGSEATRVMVFTDESDNVKKVVYSDNLLPELSILDPTLTLSMPPSVTADTGLDALVHAIETYVSVNTTPYAEILSLQAIAMIAEHLPKAFAKGRQPPGPVQHAPGCQHLGFGIRQRRPGSGARPGLCAWHRVPHVPRPLQRHHAAACHGVQPERKPGEIRQHRRSHGRRDSGPVAL